MKNKLNKFINIILVAFMVLIFPVSFFGCEPKNKTKAIIIIPGVTASNLYDVNTNKLVWPRLNVGGGILNLIMSKDFKEFIDLDGENGAYNWLNQLTIKEENNTIQNNCKPILIETLDKEKDFIRYGANNTYKELYLFLENNFKNKYDIRLFEYDWRLNNITTAKTLQNYINNHGYNEVVLIGHSMGGIVASNYIALSEENACKVKKFIPVGTPFFGATKTLSVTEDPFNLFGLTTETVDMFKQYVEQANGVGSFDAFKTKFRNFVNNTKTLYELLPTFNMSNAYLKDDLLGHGFINNFGNIITDYQEMLNFIKNKDWSNKKYLNDIQTLNNNVYKNNKHVCFSVDTNFIVGNNMQTCLQVNYNSLGEYTSCFTSNSGDSIVPLYSATCGLDKTDSKVFVFDKFSHIDIVKKEEALNTIKSIIKKIK